MSSVFHWDIFLKDLEIIQGCFLSCYSILNKDKKHTHTHAGRFGGNVLLGTDLTDCIFKIQNYLTKIINIYKRLLDIKCNNILI